MTLDGMPTKYEHGSCDKKPTAGYLKYLKYVESLRRNTGFQKEFKGLIEWLINNKQKKNACDKRIYSFCEKYDIHWGTFEGLCYTHDSEDFDFGWMFPNIYHFDICLINDLYGNSRKLKNGKKIVIFPFKPQTTKNIKLFCKTIDRLYPIAVCMHKNASKRDVIDFINKKWPEINEHLDYYRTKPYKVKLRTKYSQGIRDCIWENKDVPTKRIAEILSRNYPNHGLLYFEINQIKSQEKKKRTAKIT